MKRLPYTPMMLSFTKSLTCFPSEIPSSSGHPFARCISIIRSSSENGNESELKASGSDVPTISPPDSAVEIRFKRGSRRRRKQVEDVKRAPIKQVKDWDSMTFKEKAVEVYVGEKGILFWLNKLAYASIYIIIGGWIVFRFVGPALNLYQLDTPPLAPTSLFKG